MQIAFSIVISTVLSIFACAPVQSNNAHLNETSRIVNYDTKDSETIIEILAPTGNRHVVTLQRDANVAARARPRDIKVMGEIINNVLIIVDSYPSIAGGMSYCQAGEERFLRVLAIGPKTFHETLRLKVESCRDNIELADPGLEWQADLSILRINWLLGPSKKGMSEERTLRIYPDGSTEVMQ